MKKIMVKKFGGTSLGTLERIEAVSKRILQDKLTQKPIIVVSAMSGETNRLIDLAEKVNPSYRGLSYDMLLASGEQVSVALLTMAILRAGGKAKPFLAHQLGILTDGYFSKARITKINTQKILQALDEDQIPIIAGFQGVDSKGNITTLGRGGTDISAVALTQALSIKTCEIYTDVPGVFTADPRLISKAKEVQKISFEEMMEMSSLGSKILHTTSVELASKYKIEIHVRSTFNNKSGTWVMPKEKIMEEKVVTAVTHDESLSVVKLYPLPLGVEVLSKIFDTLAKANIIVDVITQGYKDEKQRLAFSVSKEDVSETQTLLKKILPDIECTVIENVAKVGIVGIGMKNHSGVAAKFFSVFSKNKIPIHLVTTSEIKISSIIDLEYLKLTVNRLHDAFNLS